MGTESSLSFAMTADETGTVPGFSHGGWPVQGRVIGMFACQWAMYVTSLRALVETGLGNPHAG